MRRCLVLSCFVFVLLISFVSAGWFSDFFGITGNAIIDDCSNVVGLYHFDGNANDDSGNSNDGINNGATSVTGKVGSGAYSFDGVDDYILTSNTFNLDSSYSISFWMKPSVTFDGNSVGDNFLFQSSGDVFKFNGFASLKMQSDTPNNGKFEFIFYDGGSYPSVATSQNVWNAGIWYFISTVFDDANNVMSIYVNGVLSNQITGVTGNPSEINHELYIGSSAINDKNFNGTIDELIIYNKALTSTEVTDLYNSGNGVEVSCSGSPPPTQVCNNGSIEGTEVCDGGDLNGETCVSQGFDSGSLVCASDCLSFDFSGCVTTTTNPNVIFEDDFDSHPDWSPTQGVIPQSGDVNCPAPCSSAPNGYNGYRIAASRYSDAGHNTLNIDSTNDRFDNGKAFTYWSEVCDSCGWASDGLIDVKLDAAGYKDLYVRYYIKFDPNWQWKQGAPSPQQKLIHISNYDGAGNQWSYFQTGSHHPITSGGLAKWNNGNSDISHYAGFRYENVYYPDYATPYHDRSMSFYVGTGNYGGSGDDFWDTGMMGDGQWHSFEYHVKANSDVGVPNGEYHFWIDDQIVANITDLSWADSGSQVSPRKLWNYVQLGGNNFNHYAPQSQEPEQWYAIDDLVISTSYIGPDYVIGSGSNCTDSDGEIGRAHV